MSRNQREGRYAGRKHIAWHYVDGFGWAGFEQTGRRRNHRSNLAWLGGYDARLK